MVEDFTKRDLTCESDVLRAFAGVLHTGWGQECYYGLPLRIFGNAILWTAVNKIHPRRHAAPGDVFPTWSWSSIKGPIEMCKEFRVSLAIWAIPSRSSHQLDLQFITYSVWDAGELEEPKKLESENEVDEEEKVLCSIEIRRRLAVMMAWKCGCFSGSLPSILNNRAILEDYESILGKWRSLAQLYEEAHGLLGGNMREQDMNVRFPSYMRQGCSSGSILVYTQSLNVNHLNMVKRYSGIVGWEAQEVFVIEVGDFVAEIIVGSLNMERINLVQQTNPSSHFTFLALSVKPNCCAMPLCIHAIPPEHVTWDDSAYSSTIHNIFKPPVVELMLVETENGVSRRVGLAWTYLKRWIDQNRQFRTFHLV
ncbi:HET-domain-containing protein [Aspergillus tubingensis]|uniref:HET-domain-containing protein n=1 Tax=Aspergillus tubingensis TaxID=5068 RepID=UPI0015785DD6|nr:HET-domain-containing protein [Aspergillus tubingensis]GFN13852.1 HET-domain-containing protein [Aspergillus tubingensis]